MTSDDSHDVSVKSLERLPRLAPDPDRAERVRVRCRTHLARSRRRSARIGVMTARAWRLLPPVVVGGLCVVYVAALVATTLRLQDVLR
jgi:hypothetical protein